MAKNENVRLQAADLKRPGSDFARISRISETLRLEGRLAIFQFFAQPHVPRGRPHKAAAGP